MKVYVLVKMDKNFVLINIYISKMIIDDNKKIVFKILKNKIICIIYIIKKTLENRQLFVLFVQLENKNKFFIRNLIFFE